MQTNVHELTREQKRRYSRHLLLEGFGTEGQLKLLNSKVLLIGAGGLGSPIALYLAAAGVGTLGIADGDEVSISNLQRQVLHYTRDMNRMKVESAAEKLSLINPEVKVVTYPMYLTEDNLLELVKAYDFVIEGTDSFATKYLVNDACVLAGKPFCIGGINRYSGQLMTHIPGSACYRCLFPEPPHQGELETCSQVGVLGSVAGTIGTLQATEAVKYITGTGSLLTNQLLVFNALSMDFQRLEFGKDKKCELCGEKPSIHALKEYAYQACKKKEQKL